MKSKIVKLSLVAIATVIAVNTFVITSNKCKIQREILKSDVESQAGIIGVFGLFDLYISITELLDRFGDLEGPEEPFMSECTPINETFSFTINTSTLKGKKAAAAIEASAKAAGSIPVNGTVSGNVSFSGLSQFGSNMSGNATFKLNVSGKLEGHYCQKRDKSRCVVVEPCNQIYNASIKDFRDAWGF